MVTMRDPWLIVSHEASNSGAPRMLLGILRGIRKARERTWSCEILLGRGGPLAGEFAEFGHVRRLTHAFAEGSSAAAKLFNRIVDQPLLQPRRLRRWTKQWRRAGIGLVYVNSGTNGRLMPALRAMGRPVVTHVHELAYSLRRFNRPAGLEAVLNGTDHFLAVSSAAVSDLQALGVPRERVTRVPDFLSGMPAPADAAAARREICQRLGLAQDTRLVTACGHIDRVKGPDLFVAMAGLLANRIAAPVAFLWIGGVTDRALARRVRAEVRRKGLDRVVRFVGAVEDCTPFFAASNVVVITSRVESFSLVALEAGALGRPVVGFAAARGLADLLDAGSIVPELSAPAMAERVAGLLEHPGEAARRGLLLRGRIGAEFLAERWTGEILAVAEGLAHA